MKLPKLLGIWPVSRFDTLLLIVMATAAGGLVQQVWLVLALSLAMDLVRIVGL